MDYGDLIETLRVICDGRRYNIMGIAATAIETLRADLARVAAERDAAVDCINQIEDDLDRGNDNDWVREHISGWENQREGWP